MVVEASLLLPFLFLLLFFFLGILSAMEKNASVSTFLLQDARKTSIRSVSVGRAFDALSAKKASLLRLPGEKGKGDLGFLTKKEEVTVLSALSQRLEVGEGCMYRYWMGEEGGRGKERTRKAYIFPKGSVWHTTLSCPTIKRNIRGGRYGIHYHLRNNKLRAYAPCRKCIGKRILPYGTRIQYTEEGSAYHISGGCRALYPSIREVTQKEAEHMGRKRCRRCGGD